MSITKWHPYVAAVAGRKRINSGRKKDIWKHLGRKRIFKKYLDGKEYLKGIWSEPGPRMRIRDSVSLIVFKKAFGEGTLYKINNKLKFYSLPL